MTLYPYLFFGGYCREAFTRYQEIFGGELTLLTSKDIPEDAAMPGVRDDLIMHAALQFDGHLLMGSDDPTTDSFGPVQGMMANYEASNVDQAKRVFDALAEGGEVTQPIAETFFSPLFGMCVDRFGTPWMISTEAPQQA
jgi:PhnB protein